jgi:hypothetical protein
MYTAGAVACALAGVLAITARAAAIEIVLASFIVPPISG